MSSAGLVIRAKAAIGTPQISLKPAAAANSLRPRLKMHMMRKSEV